MSVTLQNGLLRRKK
ncbi:Protein of unknown function [Leuconostoc citreum LBAE C10]|nr:Protein of unknown function [Leuconostoc citreum LBAE C10]